VEEDRGAPGYLHAELARAAAEEDVTSLRQTLDSLRSRDAAILQMYLENGYSFRYIAAITRSDPRTVARTVRRVMQRVRDWRCICLLAAGRLNDFQLAVAREYLLLGLTQREVAAHRGTNRSTVRATLRELEIYVGRRLSRRRPGRTEQGRIK
jgi:hypothetical protein